MARSRTHRTRCPRTALHGGSTRLATALLIVTVCAAVLATSALAAPAPDSSAPGAPTGTGEASAGPQATIFGERAPDRPAFGDPRSVELGVVLKASAPVSILGIRYYRGSGNVGRHVGSIWTGGGERRVSVDFADESPSGWQTALLPDPVQIGAGEEFVASYLAPAGHYAADYEYFASPRASGPLTATGSVYRYGSGGAYPRSTWRETNYWVDVVFQSGSQTLFGGGSPAVADSGDPAAGELGVRVEFLAAGRVTGLRFYKGGPANAGPHQGNLWSRSGRLLRSVTYRDESASGWQEVSLDDPLLVAAGDVVTASYYAPNGHYSLSAGALSEPTATGSLRVPPGGGVYRYGASGFPVAPYQDSNYWVDITFEAGGPEPDDGPRPPADAVLDLPKVPWEGGPDYYARFPAAESAGWTDPGFFPIGLWYPSGDSVENAAFDRSQGITMYVENSSGTPYEVYEQAGIYHIGNANDTFPQAARWWPGRFIGDEVDGRFDRELGTAHLRSVIDSFPEDDGRFHYANYTAIVASGFNTEQLAQSEEYVNMYEGPVSVDMYWYTDPACSTDPYLTWSYVPVHEAQCRTSSSYGKTIRGVRARDAADGRLKPIWSFVELMGPGQDVPERNLIISPEQLKGAAMNSVINEARGLMWFNQRFQEPCLAGTLIRTVQVDPESCAKENVAAMAEVNWLIHDLASIINTQSYDWTFGPNLDTMLKVKDGFAYVFAMISGNPESFPGERTFTLPPGLAARSVEVLDEERGLTVVDGKFTDDFPEEHVYRIYRIPLAG